MTRQWLSMIQSHKVHARAAFLVLLGVLLVPQQGDANPTFARQTGQTCSYCHVPAQEPELNSRGRDFKDCGFRFCGGSHSRDDGDDGVRRTCSANFTCKFGDSPRCYFRISDHAGHAVKELVIPAGESRMIFGLHRGAVYCLSRQPFGNDTVDALDCVLGMKDVRMTCQ